MKKIIVPVDFSEHGGIVCSYALEYARHFPSEILLYHTYFDQIIIADTSFADNIEVNTMYNQEFMREIHNQALKKIGELESGLNKKIGAEKISGVSVRSEITGGSVDTEIREVCQEYRPDLVVVGSRGEGKNVNLWGKISTYLVNHLEEPIMIVPQIREFLGFENIMVGIDLNQDNIRLIDSLLALLNTLRVNLFCVHFISDKKQDDTTERFETLKKHYSRQHTQSKLYFEMIETGEDNQKAIDQFINDHDIRMIAFKPQKHGIFFKLFTSNITRKNLYATKLPLLAIPEAR